MRVWIRTSRCEDQQYVNIKGHLKSDLVVLAANINLTIRHVTLINLYFWDTHDPNNLASHITKLYVWDTHDRNNVKSYIK